MTEAYTSLPNTLKFYGKVEDGVVTKYGSQIPFNFELISKTSKASTSYDFKTNIDNWLNGMPKAKGIHANWVVSSFSHFILSESYNISISPLDTADIAISNRYNIDSVIILISNERASLLNTFLKFMHLKMNFIGTFLLCLFLFSWEIMITKDWLRDIFQRELIYSIFY